MKEAGSVGTEHYNRNGCDRVLIFRDRAPTLAVCRRGCFRARGIGGLRAPVAAEAATVRNQSWQRVGHSSRWPGGLHSHAPPSWPAAQTRDKCSWQGVEHAHGCGEESCWYQATS